MQLVYLTLAVMLPVVFQDDVGVPEYADTFQAFVDFAVLAANRLDRVWAVVGTREGTETEIERKFHQAAGNDPRRSTPHPLPGISTRATC